MVKIDINVSGKPMNAERAHTQKNAKFLSSEAILRYLLGSDDQIETLILCKPEDIDLMTTDHNIYEALGSTKPYDNISMSKVIKLLEAVDIISYKQKTNLDKPILKDARVEELRRRSLSTKQDSNKQDHNRNYQEE
ncbi:hypothetical protein HY497_02025 [Candidatus Woesearchaeota archaeon]|nr:hypothetical protein [Candidatus Woesearchaeota archaeon]